MKKKYNNSKFEAASAQERLKLKRLAEVLEVDQNISAPHLCSYDAVFEKAGVISAIEAKCRNFEHDKYDTILIEKPKYDSLINIIRTNQVNKALYIQFFNDNYCLVFNVSRLNPVWTEEKFVKTTMGDQTKVKKEVYYIPVTEGILIKIK